MFRREYDKEAGTELSQAVPLRSERHAFRGAWLEPLPSLRYVQGLKAHADPSGVGLSPLRYTPVLLKIYTHKSK